MAINKIILIVVFQALLIISFSGCTMSPGPLGVTINPHRMPPVELTLPPMKAKETAGGKEMEQRFQNPGQQNPSAVESAIELSKRHADLSDELLLVREKNSTLTAENRKLTDKLDTLEAQSNRTQKELSQANELMIDMRIELNNWKTDIIGFRNEMRDAEKAQLQALLKILGLLGGETAAQANDIKDKASVAISRN